MGKLQTAAELRQTLSQLGLIGAGAACEPENSFGRALSHFAAFLGACALFGFLAALCASLMASPPGRLAIGLVLGLAAFLSDRNPRAGAFWSHLSLLASVASRILCYSWLFHIANPAEHPHGALLAAALIESALMAAAARPLARTVSAFSLLGFLAFDLAASGALPFLAPSMAFAALACARLENCAALPAKAGACIAPARSAALAFFCLAALAHAAAIAFNLGTGGIFFGHGLALGSPSFAPGKPFGQNEAAALVSLALAFAAGIQEIRRLRLAGAPRAASIAFLACASAGLAAVAPYALLGLLLAALGFSQGRAKTLGAGLFSALACLSAFYYALDYTLAQKSAFLAGAAAACACALLAAKQIRPINAGGPEAAQACLRARPGPAAFWPGAALLAFAAVCASAVAEKESLLARGTQITMRLAPADPRSLMQGDYMALNFEQGPSARELMRDKPACQSGSARCVALLEIGPDGLARAVAVSEEDQAASDALKIRVAYGPRGIEFGNFRGRQGFFFQEGQAEAYSKAAYASLKVDPHGNATVTDLLDPQRRPIRPQSSAGKQ